MAFHSVWCHTRVCFFVLACGLYDYGSTVCYGLWTIMHAWCYGLKIGIRTISAHGVVRMWLVGRYVMLSGCGFTPSWLLRFRQMYFIGAIFARLMYLL